MTSDVKSRYGRCSRSLMVGRYGRSVGAWRSVRTIGPKKSRIVHSRPACALTVGRYGRYGNLKRWRSVHCRPARAQTVGTVGTVILKSQEVFISGLRVQLSVGQSVPTGRFRKIQHPEGISQVEWRKDIKASNSKFWGPKKSNLNVFTSWGHLSGCLHEPRMLKASNSRYWAPTPRIRRF